VSEEHRNIQEFNIVSRHVIISSPSPRMAGDDPAANHATKFPAAGKGTGADDDLSNFQRQDPPKLEEQGTAAVIPRNHLCDITWGTLNMKISSSLSHPSSSIAHIFFSGE
jgi:hypothetical protein